MPKQEALSAAGVEWVLGLVESDYASIAAGQAAAGVLEIPQPMAWIMPKLEASVNLQGHPPELRRVSAENACRHAVESGVLKGAWGGIAQSLRCPGSDTSAVRGHRLLSTDPDPLRQMLSHTVGLVEKADRGEPLSGTELQALKARNKEFLAANKTYGADDEQLHTAVYEALVDRFDFLVDRGHEKTAAAPYRRILEGLGAKIEVLPPAPAAAPATESAQEPRTRVHVPTPWGSRRAAAMTAVATAAAVTLTGNAMASAKTPDTPPKPAPASQPASPATHTEPKQPQPTAPKTTAPATPPAAPVSPKQPPAEKAHTQAPTVTNVQSAPRPSAGDSASVISVDSSTAPEKVVTILGSTAGASTGNTQPQTAVSVVPDKTGVSPAQPEGAAPPAAATVISSADPDAAPQIADTDTGGVDPVYLAAANDLTDFYKEHGNTLNVASALTEAYIAKGATPSTDSALTQKVTTTVTGLGLNDPGAEPNQAGVNAILQAEFPDQSISTAPPASQPKTQAVFTSVVASSLATDTTDGLAGPATTEGVDPQTVQSIANSLAQAAADVTPQTTQQAIVAEVQGQGDTTTQPGDGAGTSTPPSTPPATPTPPASTPAPAPSTPQPAAPKPPTPPKPAAPKHEQGSSAETSKTQAQINRLVKFGVPEQYAKLYVKYGNMYASKGISPEFLAAQGKQESGYDPTAKSPAGALGISQFMPGTWGDWKKALGFPDSATPFDPEYAIHAQAAMMASLRGVVAHLANNKQSVTQLSLAAYNAGAGNVEKYGGIPPFKETQNYVPDILSIVKQIVALPLGSTAKPAKQSPPSGNALPASVKLGSQQLGYARFVAKVPNTPSASGHDVFFIDQADLKLDNINTGDACGLSTAVGVVSSLKKTTPDKQLITKIHQDLENIGEYTDDPNTGGIQDQGEGLLKYLHDTYGFNVSTILHEKRGPTTDAVMAQVRAALDQNKAGKPTILIVHTSNRVDGSQGNSPTNNTNGHYLYMYAYDDNGYYVANVGAAADTSPQGKAYTRDEIKGWIDGFYVVSQ